MLLIDADLIRDYLFDPPHPRSIPLFHSCVFQFSSWPLIEARTLLADTVDNG